MARAFAVQKGASSVSKWYQKLVPGTPVLLQHFPLCVPFSEETRRVEFLIHKDVNFPTYLSPEMHGKRLWKRGRKGIMVSVGGLRWNKQVMDL